MKSHTKPTIRPVRYSPPDPPLFTLPRIKYIINTDKIIEDIRRLFNENVGS